MSGSYSSRLRAGSGSGSGGGLGATTLLAAKVAFASAALAAAASLARVVLPQIVSSADAFLWKLCLFVTVHIIIFVIWKLSDNKHFHAAAHKDPWAPTPHHPAPPLLTEEVVLSAMKRKVEFAPAAATPDVYRVPPSVSRPHLEAPAASPVDEEVVSPGSCGGESCITTESEEDAASSAVAASAHVATADTWRSVESAPAPARKRAVFVSAPAPVQERAVIEPATPSPAREPRAVVERVVSLPPIAATDEHFDGADLDDDANNDDDLDATWNAIMQKTRPATAPAMATSSTRAPRSSPPRPAPSPRPRARHEDDANNYDDLDATWNAIMQKTRPATAPALSTSSTRAPRSSPPRPRAREPSVGAAELSKRSEDFIKKIHHSFGRNQ